jgi:LmbE family N-acetylglucosaminyl deacetylase
MSYPAIPRRVMSVLAHPDDETFGNAGLFYRLTHEGHQVAVVCATRGEAGEIADPSLATRETLGRVREQELRAACAIVGVTDVSFLDYLDGHLAEADPAEAVGRIVTHIRRVRPDVLITFPPNGIYGHPDHIAIHYLALAAVLAAADPSYQAAGASHRASKVYFNTPPREPMLERIEEARRQGQDFVPGGNAATIPIEEMGSPMRTIALRVELTDEELRAKIAALQAHATQMPPDSPFTQQDPAFVREFMGTETYVLAPPPVSARAFAVPETDPLAGL